MKTIYYIRLEAKLSVNKVEYKAHWSDKAKGFTTSAQPLAAIDDLEAAKIQFKKILAPLKPEYWSGCYQIGIWAEVWQGDELLKAEYVETYQTPAFTELQKS